jgi:hypothetical protein
MLGVPEVEKEHCVSVRTFLKKNTLSQNVFVLVRVVYHWGYFRSEHVTTLEKPQLCKQVPDPLVPHDAEQVAKVLVQSPLLLKCQIEGSFGESFYNIADQIEWTHHENTANATMPTCAANG